ncbi:MAG: BON domain-containing protein [Chloroflexi bacterium]|nr:BON domain-containing protein [Chloroflexota bacterium]
MSWVVRAPGRDLERAEKKLYSRVRRVLWEYEPLRASHAEIDIGVAGQVVRLRGRVRTMPQKLIAGVLVERMTDVEEVTNELVADPEVVRAVADALAQDERTAAYVLRVHARHGIVVLRGEVPNQDVQRAAIDVAAMVPLVSSVRNALAIGGEAQSPVALARPSITADELDPVAATTVRA